MIFIIDDRIGAAGQDAGGDPRTVAEMAGGQHIGRAQQIGNPVDDRFIFPAGPVSENNRFGAELFLVGQDPTGNRLQGLIPGDALPLSASLGAFPFQRIGKPVRVIDELGGGQSLAAKGPVADGTIRVAGYLGDFTVLDIDQDPASTMAVTAMTPDHRIIAVNLHLPLHIGIFELNHKNINLWVIGTLP